MKNSRLLEVLTELASWSLQETGRYPRLITAPTDEVINYRRGLFKVRRRGLLEQLVARDGLYCKECGKIFTSKYDKELTIDHKIPIAQGGKHIAIANLQILCVKCHKEKKEVFSLQRA